MPDGAAGALAVCGAGWSWSECELHALAAALHALHVHCTALACLYLVCHRGHKPAIARRHRAWPGENWRGLSTVLVLIVWVLRLLAASLRPQALPCLVRSTLALPAWIAGAILHTQLRNKQNSASLIALLAYWASYAVIAFIELFVTLQASTLDNLRIILVIAEAIPVLFIISIDVLVFCTQLSKRDLYLKRKYEIDARKGTYKHQTATFYSKITFAWVYSILYKFYTNTLDEEDMNLLHEEETPEKHYFKLKAIFSEELAKVKETSDLKIWKCLAKFMWPNLYIGGLLKMLGDAVGFVAPLGLAVVLGFIEHKNGDANTAIKPNNMPVTITEFFNNGYIMSVIILISTIIQGLLSQNSTHLICVEGIRTQTALQGLIFDKSLSAATWHSEKGTGENESFLAPSKSDRSVGQVTNLVTQDAYNIMTFIWVIHYIWAIPLKVSILIYLLYTKLGASAIIGTVTCILLTTPLQLYLGKKIAANSKNLSKLTDQRMNKMTEILQGIHLIKLYMWEDLFKERILTIREVELKFLNKDSLYWCVFSFITETSTILVTVLTFTMYFLIKDMSENLSVVNIFAGLALFNQLVIPLLILPITTMMALQAKVSSKRIEHFLSLPNAANTNPDFISEVVSIPPQRQKKFNDAFLEDITTDSLPSLNNGVNTIVANNSYLSDIDEAAAVDVKAKPLMKLTDAVFTWGNDEYAGFSVEISNMEIQRGKLIMVVGPTGSGKSSFLSALGGEMRYIRGEFIKNGRWAIAYCGWRPWLAQGDVRANIVQGEPWCPRRYARVLRLTDLRPDMRILPEGDLTVLGRGGGALSGGQAARVCVARALYSRAPLLLLDGALAPLDAPLARRLLARAIAAARADRRTILLATNRLEFVHYADSVVMVHSGRCVMAGRARRVPPAPAAPAVPSRTRSERAGLARALRHSPSLPAHTQLWRRESSAGSYLLAEMPAAEARAVEELDAGACRHSDAAAGAGNARAPALLRHASTPARAGRTPHDRRHTAALRRAHSAAPPAPTATPASGATATSFTRKWTSKPKRKLITPASANTLERQEHGDQNALQETDEQAPANKSTNYCENTDNATTPIYDQEKTSCWEWWWSACGWWGCAGALACAAVQGLRAAAEAWVAVRGGSRSSVLGYAGWSGAAVLVALCGRGLCALGAARARRRVHHQAAHAALHAPLHAASAHLARTLSTFAADLHIFDTKLIRSWERWWQLAAVCWCAALLAACAAPLSLLVLAPLLPLFFCLQAVYLRTATRVVGMEGRALCEVVGAWQEGSAGGVVARCGGVRGQMTARALLTARPLHAALLHLHAANRAVSLALDVCGGVCAGAVVWWAARGEGGAAGAGAAGLGGAAALLLPAYLAHLAKSRADLHGHLAAARRLRTLHRLPQEDHGMEEAWNSWSPKSDISLVGVDVRPAPAAPIALRDLSLTIAAGEKVGVVGRSGSGKSTLLLALCGGAGGGIISSGRVYIGNFEASKVPLRALRRRVLLLPQDASQVFFAGTLRDNLDPLAVHTDEEIWQCLRLVRLDEFVSAQTAGIECMVGGAGGEGAAGGWTAGRRCRAVLCRAVLRAPAAAALLLDEAGAALPPAAEAHLLADICSRLPAHTVLAVAHRASSVLSLGRVLVMDKGQLVESGDPRRLATQPRSRFSRLLRAERHHDPHH